MAELPDWIEQLGRDAEAALGDPGRPYRRPGDWHLLTAEQWECFDGLTAARDRQVDRFGALAERLGVASGRAGVTRGRLLL